MTDQILIATVGVLIAGLLLGTVFSVTIVCNRRDSKTKFPRLSEMARGDYQLELL